MSGALILGWFGLPKLGVSGAAVSVVVAMALMASVLMARLTGGDQVLQLRVSALRRRRELFADIFKVGTLVSLSPVLTVLSIAGPAVHSRQH